MKKLVIATRNPGKFKEISSFLSDLPLEILSLKNVGIMEDVEETGKTYKENSQRKAIFYAKKSRLPAIADDGGLEIEALNGEPGIKSRRWLGFDATDEDLIEHMRKIARELPDNKRKAWFKVVISLALPNGKVFSVTGKVKGIIAKEPQVQHMKGFPYRHFFYLPKIKKYYQNEELTPDEQRRYNHRYMAVTKLKPIIKEVFKGSSLVKVEP